MSRGWDSTPYWSFPMPNIHDARVLIIATDGVEQAELITPRDDPGSFEGMKPSFDAPAPAWQRMSRA
jgi:hypothetical protein